MEISKLLTSTPEQVAKRKAEWEKKVLLEEQGRNYEKEKAEDRAHKALVLLKAHLEGTNILDDNVKIALCGIVMERSISSFFFFVKYVLEMDLMSDITHKRWADDHQVAILKNKKRVMRLKPRGSFKTSLYGIGTILYVWACISPEIRIFYTSANGLLLQEVADKLSQYIGSDKGETLYSMIFGITKEVGVKNTADVFNIKGRSGKGFSLILRTAGGSSNGVHPNIIIVDDPCFAPETPVLTSHGDVSIKDIKVGDKVVTRYGLRKVTWSGVTQKNAMVYDHDINGKVLTCTKRHKIITKNRGKVSLSEIGEDTIIKYEESVWKSEKLVRPKLLNLTESSTEDTQSLKERLIEDIFSQAAILKEKFLFYIVQSGCIITEKFLVVFISIIRMAMSITTKLRILKSDRGENIAQNMRGKLFSIQNTRKLQYKAYMITVISRVSGTNLTRVGLNLGRFIKTLQWLKRYAWSAEESSSLKPFPAQDKNIVPENAECQNTSGWEYQAMRPKKMDVYNITVESVHEFVANGVLVANCDINDRESEATRQSKIRWFDGLKPLLVPFKDKKTKIEFETIYYISTIWHMRDLTNQTLEKNEKLPEAQKWDVESESICNDAGESNYPDFISNQKIAEIRADMSDVFFSCQYMNQAMMEGMQIFDFKKLTFVREEQVNIKDGQIVCFFDPSLGKASSDYPMTIWFHVQEGIMTIIDAIDKKVELSLIVHQIADRNKKYGCRTIVFENNGITLIEQSLKDAHDRSGWLMQYEPIHHSSNKNERILSTQPDLYSGAVRFLSDYMTRYPEMMNQIIFYPVYGHDDGPDCMEMGISYFRQQHFVFQRFEGCL